MRPSDQSEHLQLPAARTRPTRSRCAKETLLIGMWDSQAFTPRACCLTKSKGQRLPGLCFKTCLAIYSIKAIEKLAMPLVISLFSLFKAQALRCCFTGLRRQSVQHHSMCSTSGIEQAFR